MQSTETLVTIPDFEPQIRYALRYAPTMRIENGVDPFIIDAAEMDAEHGIYHDKPDDFIIYEELTSAPCEVLVKDALSFEALLTQIGKMFPQMGITEGWIDLVTVDHEVAHSRWVDPRAHNRFGVSFYIAVYPSGQTTYEIDPFQTSFGPTRRVHAAMSAAEPARPSVTDLQLVRMYGYGTSAAELEDLRRRAAATPPVPEDWKRIYESQCADLGQLATR